MEPFSLISLLSFGFVLGLKHAVDADHLAAVSTMASERASLVSSSLIGALWGVGHTISLMIAGIVVIFLGFEISERTSQVMEFCVGLMLVVLGVRTLIKLLRGGHLHVHVHQHGGHVHAHPHVHDALPKAEPHSHHGSGIWRAAINSRAHSRHGRFSGAADCWPVPPGRLCFARMGGVV